MANAGRMAKRSTPAASRVVRLFKNGRNQAVRIPREFELPGRAALVTKDGDRLILAPVAKKNFIDALRALGPFPRSDEMPEIDDRAPEPVELHWGASRKRLTSPAATGRGGRSSSRRAKQG